MKVLLVQPKYSYPQDNPAIPLIVEMPLGLCYLAAVLREKGHQVEILDCLAEGYGHKESRGQMAVYGLNDNEIVQRINSSNPDIIGCSALFSVQYENVKNFCLLVKKLDKNIPLVVGGMHATVRPYEVLSDWYVNFVVRGEADYTFAELVESLEKRKDYSRIDGIGYKKRGKIFVNPKRNFIKNLDELPFPARDLLKIEKYYQAGLAHGLILKSKRNVNLITSRGCPGGCVFCTINQLWGRKFRARSPESVLLELKQVKERFGANHIQFEDDNLTFDIARAKKIFQKMIDAGLNLKWNTPNGVALWRMDKESLNLMKKSGCYYVKFAVESGNQEVLTKIIKKPQNLRKVIPLINYARKIGMKVGSFFVVGFPGETKKQIQDSFNFPYKVKLDWLEYSLATPHYGTKLREICRKKKYLKEHKSEDLFTRKGLIETPNFTASWLEDKLLRENRRYLKYLLFHQPFSAIEEGWEVIKRTPFFALKYLIGISK